MKTSLKKYTSHFIWKVVCERELDWTKTATYWPPQPLRTLPCVFLVLLDCSTGGLGAQPLWNMFSFQHLLSNSSDLQLIDFLSSPSYIIVPSPTQYLWNGMFDCNQVEITVMQFTGHSLPVHQSMSLPWDLPCPILSAKAAYVISSHNCHRNVSLLVHHFGMACLAGSKVNIQQYYCCSTRMTLVLNNWQRLIDLK